MYVCMYVCMYSSIQIGGFVYLLSTIKSDVCMCVCMCVCMYVCFLELYLRQRSAFLCMHVCKDMRCSVDLNVKIVSAYYFKRVQILSFIYPDRNTYIHTYIYL